MPRRAPASRYGRTDGRPRPVGLDRPSCPRYGTTFSSRPPRSKTRIVGVFECSQLPILPRPPTVHVRHRRHEILGHSSPTEPSPVRVHEDAAHIGIRVITALDPSPRHIRACERDLNQVLRLCGIAAQQVGQSQQPWQSRCEEIAKIPVFIIIIIHRPLHNPPDPAGCLAGCLIRRNGFRGRTIAGEAWPGGPRHHGPGGATRPSAGPLPPGPP